MLKAFSSKKKKKSRLKITPVKIFIHRSQTNMKILFTVYYIWTKKTWLRTLFVSI